ncbi:hypothetical protein RYD26_06180 [Pasteurellaceae bacterium LIM206]|nr:hypothetical protein [Pasteurellaceae bacterium LIM206]
MKSLWKLIINSLFLIFSLAYPFAVYFGQSFFSFRNLMSMMLLLWLLRGWVLKKSNQKIINYVVCTFFIIALFANNEKMAYWYPVVINGLFFCIFWISLFSRQNIIEKIARVKQPDLPPKGVIYTRKIVKLWLVFFVVNASISILLIYVDLDFWIVYTGIISYLLMGILLAGEWLYRKFKLGYK